MCVKRVLFGLKKVVFLSLLKFMPGVRVSPYIGREPISQSLTYLVQLRRSPVTFLCRFPPILTVPS